MAEERHRVGQDGKPVGPGADFDAVDAELRRLDETIDAVADLLMAESVYQLVRGNTAGASATLDSLARGVRPPDPEVVKTPRGGTAVSHRAALVLGGNADRAGRLGRDPGNAALGGRAASRRLARHARSAIRPRCAAR